MSDNNIFTGGVPTGPQVRKLEAAFPDVESIRGDVLKHDVIEEIIGEKRGTSRYRTITAAWRRKVEIATGIVIDGRGEALNIGFRVLTDGDQVGFGVDQRRYGTRRIKRGHTAIARTNVAHLTPQEKAIRTHELIWEAKINYALAAASRKLGPPPFGTPPEEVK